MLSTQLLGGSTLSAAVRTLQLAIDSAGADHVALGSDMDGALKMLIDVEGLPALADALMEERVDEAGVTAFLGGNAGMLLREGLAQTP
jgi:microsomal dipeptidase-like Zn-dependent dipeptidase